MTNIQKQNEYFESNKSHLLKKYAGKVIVIPDSLQISSFNSLEEGYSYGVSQYGYGNFMLKDCSEDPTQVQIMNNVQHFNYTVCIHCLTYNHEKYE